jgi:hypothetical protein
MERDHKLPVGIDHTTSERKSRVLDIGPNFPPKICFSLSFSFSLLDKFQPHIELNRISSPKDNRFS